MRLGARIVVAIAASASCARGEPVTLARTAAREAYERGLVLHASGDAAGAAAAFARADALDPNAVALRAALDEAALANDAVLAIELADRGADRAYDETLSATVASIRERFEGRVGRVRIRCDGLPPCRAALDRVVIDASVAHVTSVGAHSLTIERAGAATSYVLAVQPHATHDIVAAEPALVGLGLAPRQLDPHVRGRGGLPPGWAYAGLGATAVAGGAALVLGLDATRRHDAFVQDGCSHTASAACAHAADDGASAEHRANAALATSAVLGASTLIVALALVHWGARPGGASARLPTTLAYAF